MPDKTDFYRRLNIDTGASEKAIKKAYRMAVRKAHPDVNKNPGATQMFLDIQEAYQVLSDPDRKDSYDKGRDPDDVIPNIHKTLDYSQPALLRLDEPQVIYTLVDIAASDEEREVSSLPLNIAIVIDNSTSMAGNRLEILKAAAKEIIADLGEDDLVSLVSFNDRAHVLLPSQSRPSARAVDTAINSLIAEGGTEIFQGIEAGYQEIKRNSTSNYVSHILLITDGHTYGDEDDCVALAKEASGQDIGISGLGIGIEWNDAFIDQLCGLTGGQSIFIQDIQQVKKFLEQSISALKEATSRRVSLEITPAPGVRILSAFRILPEALPLPQQEVYSLGILKKDQPHRVLFEFLIGPLAKDIDRAVIASGEFSIKRQHRDVSLPFTISRGIVPPTEEFEEPSKPIFKAISHLAFYRLQERAQQDVAIGNPESAYQRLLNLSSHLMARGENNLAKIAMNEAQYIQSHNNFSPTGKKQLKYGTIHLMLPDKT
ncbi:MAG: DnaJ domain-containing protein [Anaerolineales bacterium]